MKPKTRTAPANAMARLTRDIGKRVAAGKRVRRTLPGGGRIHIDRPLPFLCVYRKPPDDPDPGTERLVTSEASYLIAPGDKEAKAWLSSLVESVATLLTEAFGACLILEIWSAHPPQTDEVISAKKITPELSLATHSKDRSRPFVPHFEETLHRVRLARRRAKVTTVSMSKVAPPGLSPLLSRTQAEAIGCNLLGLQVSAIYRDVDNQTVLPGILTRFRRSLTVALRHGFFDYARNHTTHRVPHVHALGRRAMVKAVWESDRILAEVASSFDFLLQVTPINQKGAWQAFNRRKMEIIPKLHYRPIPFEPVVLKRKLYGTPVERMEDPTLALLFRQKLIELDRQITLIQERNTPRFIHESAQLYGELDPELCDTARKMMDRIPARSRETSGKETLDALGFAKKARAEFAFYRTRQPKFNPKVELRDDVAGLMVSQGNLLINSTSSIPVSRVDALLQHEIGTHVLTYHNGKAQRFQQLYTGMAGYDALQEGLAVLAEYLVGGLSRPRLRLLAARVLAVESLLDGADFLETFRMLHRQYKMSSHAAFTVTLRVYRGGGLTKDAVYLKGFCQMLDYIGEHGKPDALYVGKIGMEHVSIIRELQWRKVLVKPPLLPRFLTRPDVQQRLAAMRDGVSILDLVERKKQ